MADGVARGASKYGLLAAKVRLMMNEGGDLLKRKGRGGSPARELHGRAGECAAPKVHTVDGGKRVRAVRQHRAPTTQRGARGIARWRGGLRDECSGHGSVGGEGAHGLRDRGRRLMDD